MWRRIINVILLTSLSLLIAQPVLAHGVGGVLRISDHKMGPYTVMVWTTPNILRPGRVHVETAILRSGMNVIDCDVQVQVTPQSFSGSAITSAGGAATVENDFRHEAAFRLDKAGTYQVDITVTDQIGRGGRVTVDVEVVQVSLWLQMLVYSLFGLSGLMGLFLLRHGVRIVWPWSSSRHL